MEKKTLTIIIVAVVAIAIIAGVVIAFSMSTTDNGGKYVTYEGNGGTTSPAGDTSYKCYSETVDETRFFRNYYQLTSFNDKADGTGKVYHTGDHVDYGTTLYAQWTKMTDLNVKIICKDESLVGVTVTDTTSATPATLKIGDNTLSNDNCSFKIKLTALDGNYFTDVSSTEYNEFYLKNSLGETKYVITVTPTAYPGQGERVIDVTVVGDDCIEISMKNYAKLEISFL